VDFEFVVGDEADGGCAAGGGVDDADGVVRGLVEVVVVHFQGLIEEGAYGAPPGDR